MIAITVACLVSFAVGVVAAFSYIFWHDEMPHEDD